MPLRWRNACTIGRLVPLYVTLGVLERMRPLSSVVAWAWRPPRSLTRDRAEEQRVAACVIRLCRAARAVDRRCLRRSLLLYRELSRLGANPSLCVGFRRNGDRTVEGHAWVVVNDEPIAEAVRPGAQFETTCCFGPGGRVLTTP
jgi:hypothetical protein